MRYAIYFTPAPDAALTQTAARWLGRDAFSQATFDDYARYAAFTAEPRRYGFHATLKAPFELSTNTSEEALLDAFSRFAASRAAFDIPQIVIGALGPFFALIPAQPHLPLQDFAADVVRSFEPFRAPLSEADIARRKPQRLSAGERDNLTRWGYPYVMDDFRFHMTLTGPVEEADRQDLSATLADVFSDFSGRALSISGLGLFVERERGHPFTVHSWQPLSAATMKDPR